MSDVKKVPKTISEVASEWALKATRECPGTGLNKGFLAGADWQRERDVAIVMGISPGSKGYRVDAREFGRKLAEYIQEQDRDAVEEKKT